MQEVYIKEISFKSPESTPQIRTAETAEERNSYIEQRGREDVRVPACAADLSSCCY